MDVRQLRRLSEQFDEELERLKKDPEADQKIEEVMNSSTDQMHDLVSNLAKIKSDEDSQITVLLPNELVGEEGDELRPAVKAMIRALAEYGYAPLDFGEEFGNRCELWFYHTDNARDAAEHFIDVGGYV